MKKTLTHKRLLYRIVQTSLLQLFIAVLFSGITLATSVKGQEMLERKVSIHVSDLPLGQVLKSLEKSAQVKFSFNSRTLNLNQNISVNATNETLTSILTKIFKPLNITHIQVSNRIVLRKEEAVKMGMLYEPIRLNIPINLDHTITGTISDEKGEKLPGVSIVVKGTTRGATTDAKGEFKISVPEGSITLILSFIGYKTQEIVVGAQTTLSLKMQPGENALEEVVVIGYGTSKRRDLTGSVGSVKAGDIAVSPVANPMEALQGRIAGLDIERGSGRAGSAPNVLLRGNRSISGGQSPLYLIDGVPGSIDALNPNDIENIDVLKDAAATSIYGVAGANGVIIITTKKAKAGKLQLDIDSYYGINGFARFPRPVTGDKWIQYQKDRYFTQRGTYTDDLVELVSSVEIRNLVQQGQWVNWVDETLKTGIQQNHFASLRGGSDKIQAYLSLGYIGEKGIYQNDESKILNIRTGLDVKFSKLLKAGVQTVISARNNDATASRVNKAYGVAPVGTPYNEDGSVRLRPLGETNATISPIANYAPGVYIDNSKNLGVNVYPYVEFTPINNLTVRSNLGISASLSRNGFFQSERAYNPASEGKVTKEASYSTAIGQSYIWENYATYNFDINDHHQFTATGIISMGKSVGETSVIAVNGLDFDYYTYYNTGAASTVINRSTGYSETSRMSYAGRLHYGYKSKYLLTVSNRWDGASQLYRNWASFPSISAAWRISDEAFMGNFNTWVTDMKLRASYGVTGNNNISPYQSVTELVSKTASSNLSLGGSGVLPIYVLKQALGNPELTWEKSYTTNLALDLALFKGKLNLTTEWYHTQTDGVLYKRTLPSTSGGFDAKNLYTKVLNIAKTENKGFEVTASLRTMAKKDFQWNTSLTFTAAREKLVSIDLGNSISATSLISENLFVGQPLKTFYDYKKVGIWQTQDSLLAKRYGARPGDIRLATVPKVNAEGVSDSGIHVYTAADRMVVGHANPNWMMGIQNSFTYKNFDLTIFVNARYGQTISASSLGYWNTTSQPETYDYWTPNNPTNDFPQPGSAFNTTFASALSFVDGSYIKVKNITFGYTLPKTLQERMKVSRLRVYGTMYNPLVYTRSTMLKGVDPESGGADSFPLFKQIVFGINLSF